MSKVFISGPYSKGDVALNVRNAIAAGDTLLELGYTPFIPHLTHFWHLVFPQRYETWLEYDKKWISDCECLLRIEGDSSGADAEVELAYKLGKKVFYSVRELIAWYCPGIPLGDVAEPVYAISLPKGDGIILHGVPKKLHLFDGEENLIIAKLNTRILSALAVAQRFGMNDGAHHKQWVIDQMVRALTGSNIHHKPETSFFNFPDTTEEYDQFVAKMKHYPWDEGMPT